MRNPSSILSALQWAEDTFGSVHLGDVRRTKRAVAIASAIAQEPSPGPGAAASGTVSAKERS